MKKIYCVHLTYHLVLFMCCTLSVGPRLVPKTLKHQSKSKYCLQGLEACVFGLMLLSLRLSFSVLLTQASKSGKVAATQDHPQWQPRLVRHCQA